MVERLAELAEAATAELPVAEPAMPAAAVVWLEALALVVSVERQPSQDSREVLDSRAARQACRLARAASPTM